MSFRSNYIIDVILVNYNNTADTIQCLNSLKKSTYPLNHVIVIDNSKLISLELQQSLASNSRTLYFKLSENLGFSGGNNFGIKESLKKSPDYILLLNNDTIVKDDFLEELLNGAITQNADLVTGKIYYYDNPDVIWGAGGWIDWGRGMGRPSGLLEKDSGQFDINKEILFISGCMMLIKREVFDKIGLFDEKYFMYHEDLDFCIRAKKANLKLIYVHNSIIWHKVGASSVTRSPFYLYYFIRNSIFIVKKYADFREGMKFIFYAPVYFITKTCIASLKNLRFIIIFFMAINDAFFNKSGQKLSKLL